MKYWYWIDKKENGDYKKNKWLYKRIKIQIGHNNECNETKTPEYA
jgi:hypothetical protein